MKLRLPLTLATLLLTTVNGISTAADNNSFSASYGQSELTQSYNGPVLMARVSSNLSWALAQGGVWIANQGLDAGAWTGGEDDDNNFYDGDNVTFGDLDGSGDVIEVRVSGNVQPSSVTVNTTKSYKLTTENNGRITGSGSFLKTGSGTVILDQSYALTGSFNLQEGILEMAGALTLYDFSGAAGTVVNQGTNALTIYVSPSTVSEFAGTVNWDSGASLIVTGGGTWHLTGLFDSQPNGRPVVVRGATLDLRGGRLVNNTAGNAAGFLTITDGGVLVTDKFIEGNGTNLGLLWSTYTMVTLNNGTIRFTGNEAGKRGFGIRGSVTLEVASGAVYYNVADGDTQRIGILDANSTLHLTGEGTGGIGFSTNNANPGFCPIANNNSADSLSIVKNGSGTWVLGSDFGSTIGGGITINEGTLQIGDTSQSVVNTVNGEATLGGGTVVNNGRLVFDRSVDYTINNAVSGRGDFEFLGAVVYTFTNEVTLGGGITLGTNTTLNFSNNTNAFTQAGSFLTMGAGSTLKYGSMNQQGSLTSLTLGGIATIDYNNQSSLILNINSPISTSAGNYLIIDHYNYNGTLNYVYYNNGLSYWDVLDDVKIRVDGTLVDAMLNGSGQIMIYDDNPSAGNLVTSDEPYQYTRDHKYIGSMAGDGVLVLTHELTFVGGADPVYGFTTQNDVETGIPGNSFTVDSLLTNGPSNLVRGVSMTGQSGNPTKVISLGNTNNSFTGDVNVQSVSVRAVGDVIGSNFDQNNITILGTDNTVRLTTNAGLILDTARKYDGTSSGLAGTFTYHNNVQLGQNNTFIRQDSGSHILAGDINMIGVGEKRIENTVSDTTFTLSGTIGGPSTSPLVLKTADSPDSIIALAGYGSSVTSLDIQGNVSITGQIVSQENVLLNSSGSSLTLAGGTLITQGSISSSQGSSVLAMDNGGVLRANGDLVIESGVNVDMSALGAGEVATFDTQGYKITVQATEALGRNISNTVDGSIMRKTGSGELILEGPVTGQGTLRIEAGTVTLQASGNSLGDLDLYGGAALNVNGTLSVTDGITSNGIIRGSGSILAPSIYFGNSGAYSGNMINQQWGATFDNGALFNGTLTTSGDIVFESGSRLAATLALDTSVDPPAALDRPQLIVTDGGTVTLNGVHVTGSSSTEERYWEQGTEYAFTLIQTDAGHLYGANGQILGEANLERSVIFDPTSWGAFLTGVLDYVEGEKLIVTVTRNERYTAEFARTSNQLAVSTGLDYAIDNYARLGLSGTEMGEVVRYFNAMGDDIAAEAPAAFDMLGGLSSYHALAGMRTDLLRHTENVRLRAQSGGKGINLNKETPENQLWVEGTQSYQKHQSSLNSPGYTVQTWGGAVGVDYLSAANYSLGISFAYSSLNITSTQYSAKSLADTYYVDLYGRWEKGPWSGTFVVTGSTNEVRMKRDVILDDQYYNVTGRPSGRQILGMAEVAYAIPVNEKGLYFEPAVGMWIGQTRLDSYTEKGFGNAGLEVSQQKMSIAQGVVGVRLYEQRIDPVFGHESLRWEVRTSVSQEFGDDEYHTVSRFIGAPQDFTTRGNSVGKTSFHVGGSVSVALDNRWSVFADAGGEFRKDVKGMTSALGLRCTF